MVPAWLGATRSKAAGHLVGARPPPRPDERRDRRAQSDTEPQLRHSRVLADATYRRASLLRRLGAARPRPQATTSSAAAVEAKAALPTPIASTLPQSCQFPERRDQRPLLGLALSRGAGRLSPSHRRDQAASPETGRGSPALPVPTDPPETSILWRAPHFAISATTSTGGWSPSSSRTATMRSHLGRR